jgi:hypothetical protein
MMGRRVAMVIIMVMVVVLLPPTSTACLCDVFVLLGSLLSDYCLYFMS